MNRRRFLQGSISAATASALPTASRAQQYPTKLMRYLVGFPPGGSADLTMRQFAFRLDAVLGAKNVIENVAGASSTLAAVQTVRAEPDGHTLYLGSNVSQVIAPVMLKLSYDPLTALAPISQVTTNSNLVAVSAGYGVKNWAAFLAEDPATRSNTSICLKITDPAYLALSAEDQAKHAKSVVSMLDKESAAYDIGSYRDAPAGIRVWGGATVETSDVELLLPWLDWAYEAVKASF